MTKKIYKNAKKWDEFYNNILLNSFKNLNIDSFIRNTDNDTLLMLAVCLNNLNLTIVLLQQNFNINHINNDGENVLISYVRCKLDNMGNNKYFTINQLAIVEYLLISGINVNQQDTVGKTALMYASEAGDIGIIKILLLHSANKSLKDNLSKLAIEYNDLSYDYYNEINGLLG